MTYVNFTLDIDADGIALVTWDAPGRSMNVMVAGGAGYIGSHAVKILFEAGHRVVAIDNLFRGHRQAVHPKVAFHQVDLAETRQLADIAHAHGLAVHVDGARIGNALARMNGST